MAKKYTEIGELRELENDDGSKSLYIKVFIKDKDGRQALIKSGDLLKLEDPALKYDRMIAKADSEDVDKLIAERDKIPSYVKRRVTLVQGE